MKEPKLLAGTTILSENCMMIFLLKKSTLKQMLSYLVLLGPKGKIGTIRPNYGKQCMTFERYQLCPARNPSKPGRYPRGRLPGQRIFLSTIWLGKRALTTSFEW